MFWQGPFEAFWWGVQVSVGKLNTRRNNFLILISIKLNCISKFSNQLGSIILQPKVLLILLYSQVLHIWFLNTYIMIVLESRQFSLFKKDIGLRALLEKLLIFSSMSYVRKCVIFARSRYFSSSSHQSKDNLVFINENWMESFRYVPKKPFK